ncbi:MAG: hypothetical protein E7379_03885 [Clostridiales bacterium]|nr:hypothetical protein [Clostridiales bacterium]
MNIIGLTGHTERGHDGSVCLLQNGKITYLAEEERFSRKKHAYDCFPSLALERCLKFAGLTLEDIDYFATGWDYPVWYNNHNRKWDKEEYMSHLANVKEEKIITVNHHYAHASSAYFPSGFKSALVLVIDGQGEKEATSVFVADERKLERVFESDVSFGFFFSATTKQCGFKVGEEGKTMGLVPYGELNKTLKDYLNKIFYFDCEKEKLVQPFDVVQTSDSLDEQDQYIDAWLEIFNKFIARKTERIVDLLPEHKVYADFAYTCQIHMEDVVKTMVGHYATKYKKDKLCIAGGVGLSCKMNAKILYEVNQIKDIFVQPAANDGGVSLGSALYVANQKGDDVFQTMNPYMGSSYTDEEILKVLNENKIKYSKPENLEKEVAYLLAQNNIFAVFNGRLEFGPRALGNRSILANPKDVDTWYKLNALKGRELWRPLAPILREENTKELFNISQTSPFMTIAVKATQLAQENIPAAVHVDQTARIQTVAEKQNKFIYDVLKEFEMQSGIKALINTSFNKRGEPIIESPENAIRSFMEMQLDYLVLGSYLIRRKDNE